jgi:hypothetical protein
MPKNENWLSAFFGLLGMPTTKQEALLWHSLRRMFPLLSLLNTNV